MQLMNIPNTNEKTFNNVFKVVLENPYSHSNNAI